MSNSQSISHLLSMPENVGRAIVESAALVACPLLSAEKFAAFCKDRDLSVDKTRLLRLEKLGIFSPIFRLRTPRNDECADAFIIPIRNESNWFDKGLAWDTTAIPTIHNTPDINDKTQEGYYSIFQIDGLRLTLSQMTLHVQLDSYLDWEEPLGTRKIPGVADWIDKVRFSLEASRVHEFRPAVAALCQYISNRYYPQALGDKRHVRVGGTAYFDRWISVDGFSWDWDEERRRWDPREVEARFDLNPEKLRHAYQALASGQNSIDPLCAWQDLVQFISIDRRQRLKGVALQAQTIREGALMLRWLYADLYKEELPPPNEVHSTIYVHVPELNARKDVRRHLEFVVNKYGINPQPKLTLFVEGQSEERVVNRLFEEYFGLPASRCWIELIVIGGVDNATGGKKGGYRAILRLIDYLHHHQTLVVLMMDNENHAAKLREAASRAKSVHGHRNYITRPEYIHVWKVSFEFDNFSDSEIAKALSKISCGGHVFRRVDVAECRKAKAPGAALTDLYHRATNFSLPKLKLADALVDLILSESSRRNPGRRPIVRLLEKAAGLATTNYFPTMERIWKKNQKSRILSKKG